MWNWPSVNIASLVCAAVLVWSGEVVHEPEPPMSMAPFIPGPSWWGPSLLALPAAAEEEAAEASAAKPRHAQGSRAAPYRKQRIGAHSSAWRFEPYSPAIPVRALFEQLRSSPERRSSEVTELVEAVAYCTTWRQRRDALQAERARLERGQGGNVDLGSLQEAVALGEPVCTELPQDASRLQDRWLTDAAASGDEKAQYLYASGHLQQWHDQLNLMRYPEEVEAYKARAKDYLERLARQGHEDSLLALADAHERGTLSQLDPAMAYVYRHAALQAEGPGEVAHWAAGARKGLDANTLADAEREAEKLFQECCVPH